MSGDYTKNTKGARCHAAIKYDNSQRRQLKIRHCTDV